MNNRMDFESARDMLLALAAPVGTERVPLEDSYGRVLAQALRAAENVPAFDRSPYDGYALRAVDVAHADKARPVTLRVLEEVPAGALPSQSVLPGTAIKLLTGAPIPDGADCVVMYEKTAFTRETVTLFTPLCAGDNIVRAGEDMRAGQLLAAPGTAIDAGLCGALAAQGIAMPEVYRRPRVGIISTGNEIVEPGDAPPPGKIYNASRYTLTTALLHLGCKAMYVGIAGDRVEDIRARIEEGLAACDALLLTGGVSVGDYDLTPAAMEAAGVRLLARGVDLKPGMACAYGERDGKLVIGLSGNPASAMTNFHAVVQPALRALCGTAHPLPAPVELTLSTGFPKESKATRLLRGTLDCTRGYAALRLPGQQSNAVISSLIGCNAMAIVPAGSGPLAPGTKLKGFLL